MSRLILIRHAKSDYPPGVPDHDRPLNDRGIRNAHSAGEHLADVLAGSARPFAVAVSTARRAQQTWELISSHLTEFHGEFSAEWNDRTLYLADPHTLIELGEASAVPTLLIVGHNPGLEQLAAMASGFERARDRVSGRLLSEGLPTSSIVVLDTPDPWRIARSSVVDFVICR